MIFLFTDFGSSDIYVGQMKAALLRRNPSAQIIDLLHEATSFDVEANAHLLAALARHLPQEAVVVAVIDPGVGGQRQAVAIEADGRWYIGPDNGLLSVLVMRADTRHVWRVIWEPPLLSSSFHGRDLFAPVAAMLEAGKLPEGYLEAMPELSVKLNVADLSQLIYIDHYGNVMTGLRAQELSAQHRLEVGGKILGYARVFCDVPHGEAFWYENSIGLVEIAVNQGNAAQQLDLVVGDDIRIIDPQEKL